MPDPTLDDDCQGVAPPPPTPDTDDRPPAGATGPAWAALVDKLVDRRVTDTDARRARRGLRHAQVIAALDDIHDNPTNLIPWGQFLRASLDLALHAGVSAIDVIEAAERVTEDEMSSDAEDFARKQPLPGDEWVLYPDAVHGWRIESVACRGSRTETVEIRWTHRLPDGKWHTRGPAQSLTWEQYQDIHRRSPRAVRVTDSPLRSAPTPTPGVFPITGTVTGRVVAGRFVPTPRVPDLPPCAPDEAWDNPLPGDTWAHYPGADAGWRVAELGYQGSLALEHVIHSTSGWWATPNPVVYLSRAEYAQHRRDYPLAVCIERGTPAPVATPAPAVPTAADIDADTRGADPVPGEEWLYYPGSRDGWRVVEVVPNIVGIQFGYGWKGWGHWTSFEGRQHFSREQYRELFRQYPHAVRVYRPPGAPHAEHRVPEATEAPQADEVRVGAPGCSDAAVGDPRDADARSGDPGNGGDHEQRGGDPAGGILGGVPDSGPVVTPPAHPPEWSIYRFQQDGLTYCGTVVYDYGEDGNVVGWRLCVSGGTARSTAADSPRFTGPVTNPKWLRVSTVYQSTFQPVPDSAFWRAQSPACLAVKRTRQDKIPALKQFEHGVVFAACFIYEYHGNSVLAKELLGSVRVTRETMSVVAPEERDTVRQILGG